MKKYEWRYWFAGMKRPMRIPEGCQRRITPGVWAEEGCGPGTWREAPRRWKIAIKTCKWCESDVFGIINPHTGVRNEDEITYCPTCGKPVEIVKKGAK